MNVSVLQQYLVGIERTWVYVALIGFYGLYPILTSLIYIVTAAIYYFRRPPKPLQYLSEKELPFVSIIIPAYCEEDVIGQSILGVLGLDYPAFELIVVNDGSTDRTADRIRPFLKD